VSADGVEIVDSYEKYEVVKLVLQVKFTAPDGDDEEEKPPALTEEGEEIKFRPMDRVVIVRYFIRESEEEGGN